MDVAFKSYLFSSFLNILDLITSFIDFSVGYTELNNWMGIFHNPYVSATVAVVLFQVILSALFLLTMLLRNKLGNSWVLILTFGLTKLYPIINNIIILI